MSGETFALERLRADPQLDYETLRQQAELEGIVVQPIQYGRARRQLGLTGTSNPAANPAQAESAAESDGAATLPPLNQPSSDATPPPPPVTPLPPASHPPPNDPPTPTPTPGPGLTRKSTPAFEFLVESLQADPTLSFGELKQRADEKQLKIAPIMYGRAKALLGLVPVRPRGQGKNRKNSKKLDVTNLRPATAASPDQFSEQLERVRNLEDLVRIAKVLDAERRQLRGLLQQIADTIESALGDDD